MKPINDRRSSSTSGNPSRIQYVTISNKRIIPFLYSQIPTADQLDSIHDRLLRRLRLHSIFVDGRDIPIATAQFTELDCRLMQFGIYVYGHQNLSLFGAREFISSPSKCSKIPLIVMLNLPLSILFFQLITTAGTFWMYSIFCAGGVLFVIAFVPETKGRDLNSIAKLFASKEEKAKAIKQEEAETTKL